MTSIPIQSSSSFSAYFAEQEALRIKELCCIDENQIQSLLSEPKTDQRVTELDKRYRAIDDPLDQAGSRVSQVTGKYFSGYNISSNASFFVWGATFIPARIIHTAHNVFQPVSTTTLNVANTLLLISSAALGVFYLVDLIANSHKICNINALKQEMRACMQGTPGSDDAKAIAYLKVLQAKVKVAAEETELKRFLGDDLVEEIKHAQPHTQARELIDQIKTRVEQQQVRAIIGVITDILGIATTILSLPFGVPLAAFICNAGLMLFTSIGILFDLLPAVEKIQSMKERQGKGFMIITAIAYLLTMGASIFLGVRDNDAAAIAVSATLDALWMFTAVGVYRSYKKSRHINAVAEITERLRKRHFEAVKKLLKLYETLEKRREIIAYVKENLNIGLHDYLDRLNNEASTPEFA